jgi:hypothetical protein
MELQRAEKRWRWVYFTGYASAVYAAVVALAGVIRERAPGEVGRGIEPVEPTVEIVTAVMLAVLARRIQRDMSTSCVIMLFALVLLSAIVVSFEDNPKETIGAWILAMVLFRGVLSVRTLRQLRADRRLDRRHANPT